jgi:hypothetical protein
MSANVSNLITRFLRPDEPDLSLQMARHIASFKLDDAEQARLAELADKCNDGTLTPEEHAEYEAMVILGEFLTLLKAKALLTLKHQPTAA